MVSTRQMKRAAAFFALATLLLLPGCVTSNCAGWKPIAPARSDTSGTKRAVLKHNSFGVDQGCWAKGG